MRCPSCASEFEPGVLTCPECDVALQAADGPLTAPLAPVGRFHPAAARVVITLAERRGIRTDTLTDSDGIQVLAAADERDDLRAQLVVDWGAVLAGLEPEERTEVSGEGGTLPGWRDPPDGAWVDRWGRLQVTRTREEEQAEDESRLLGPALLTAALILGLLAWYSGEGNLRLLAAVGAMTCLLVGLFSPR